MLDVLLHRDSGLDDLPWGRCPPLYWLPSLEEDGGSAVQMTWETQYQINTRRDMVHLLIYGCARSWLTHCWSTPMACCLCARLTCWLSLCDRMSSTKCSTYSGAREIKIPNMKFLSILFRFWRFQQSGIYSKKRGSLIASGQTRAIESSGHNGSFKLHCSCFQRKRLRDLRIDCRNYC